PWCGRTPTARARACATVRRPARATGASSSRASGAATSRPRRSREMRDQLREMHLHCYTERIRRNITAMRMPFDIACEYLQAMIKAEARRYDAQAAARAQRDANRRAWRREHPAWSPAVIAELQA